VEVWQTSNLQRLRLGEEKKKREGLFSTIQQYSCKTDSIKTQSGGLPERHKAHLSWPPIVTKTITQNQFTAKCKVQGAKGTNVHKKKEERTNHSMKI